MAEYNLKFTWRRTLVHERRAVMGIRKRGGASLLEKLGITRRLTRLRTIVMVPATKLVRTKGFAPTLTTHHRTLSRSRPQLQLLRTRFQQIDPAPDHGTNAFALVRCHRHGEVETVHEAHLVGRQVLFASVVEAELRQRHWRGAAEAVALYAVAAVSRGTRETAVGVGTACSSPDAAGPLGSGCGEGTVGQCLKGKAAAFEDRVAGVGLDSWVNGERTVVNDC